MDFVDVDNVGDVSTRRIVSQIPIDGAIVSGANLQASLKGGARVSSECHLDWFLNDLQVTLGQEFTLDVWKSLIGSVDQDNLEQNVIMVNLNKSLSIERVRVASQLVDFGVYVFLDLSQEIFTQTTISSFT